MKVIINVHGGVVQDVYVDHPNIEVILIDWDTEGCGIEEDSSFVAIEAAGGAIAKAVAYRTSAMAEMPADMQEAVAKAG
jgi:hypothetical protein